MRTVNRSRVRTVKEASGGNGPVVYWMSRDQRSRDNWALLFAQELALSRKRPLIVVFCLAPGFLGATLRQYGFMLKGLKAVAGDLAKKNIPFCVVSGEPPSKIPEFAARHSASAVVTDFDPLAIKRRWKSSAARSIGADIYEVDAHNIVPCWLASPKQEFGAYTLRPKLLPELTEYLKDYHPLKRHPYSWKKRAPRIDWDGLVKGLRADDAVPEVDWIEPGESAAVRAMERFIDERLASYSATRNDPSENGTSRLSPYLHFGQLSAQRLALEVRGSGAPQKAKDAFLEELIVRRELADNFCYYNKDYGRFEGFPRWARETLDRHRKDKREYVYGRDQFERALTHDDLWNAAQQEMVLTGRMHGYMRMYWAKKILEWSASPEKAMETAVYLNDRYELDGRDPNGYAGIAWSIGGVHDRPWFERPVFGNIRFMSYNGCASKFSVDAYIAAVRQKDKELFT